MGISGRGTYVVSIVGIAPKTKKGCSMTAAPVAWQQMSPPLSL